MGYNLNQRAKKRLPKRLAVLLLILVVLIGGGIVVARHAYNQGLLPVSGDQATKVVVIAPGSGIKNISSQLAAEHLIRSTWAFELYIHSKEVGQNLQAGTYALSPSQSVPAIVDTLTRGAVATNLVTILPGRRIDQLRADLINDGFSPSSVDHALQPDQYADLPVLAYKPASVKTLEGLLYPDSFQRTANTDPSVIIRESLEEMGQKLTPAVQAALAQHSLSTYQGLTLASIIEKEVSKPVDKAQAAQVFIRRLQTGMALGSDVTAIYGAISSGQGGLSQASMLAYDSPYNTALHTGLPPTPISTVSAASLQAVAQPADTNWLYFVSGDDGTTYFSQTLDEHNQQTAQYCHKLCGQ